MRLFLFEWQTYHNLKNLEPIPSQFQFWLLPPAPHDIFVLMLALPYHHHVQVLYGLAFYACRLRI